jgi:hypothetical protein
MNRRLALLSALFLLSCSLNAQELLGHRLGESVEQFATARPGLLNDQWVKCHSGKKLNKRENEGCSAAAKVSDGSVEGEISSNFPLLLSGDVSGHFLAGKLIGLKILVRSSYDEVRPDIISRFGAPAGETQDVLQNGFGATYQLTHAHWIGTDGAGYMLTADESLTGDGRSVTIVYGNHEYFARELARLKAAHQDALK